MKGFCPLASGSKGNSIYIGTQNTKLLIDAGISGRATKNRLAEINVDITDIDAILITHDHGDHIKGLKVLAYKLGIPVFANQETAKGIVNLFHDCPKFKIFSTGETFEFGDMEIHPFSVQHDTMDPVAFTIRINDLKLGFCTDLGYPTTLVRKNLADCDYLYVEANHQPTMVDACSRPDYYKKRVKGHTGHLSNEACGQLISQCATNKLKHVHLAHLSSECNTPETALDVVNDILKKHNINVDMCIAPQDKISRAISF